MSLPTLIQAGVALAAVLFSAVPLAGAQVYKWVDDKGVVNYGSKPPASARGAKGATIIEDRVSVYTPDPAVTQATQNARDRSGLPNAARSHTAQQPERDAPPPLAAAPVPSPGPSYDPCAIPEDINCYAYPPVYPRSNHTPRLVQPRLPPGAIAGNVNQGMGYTPGLSTQAQSATPPPTNMRPPASGSFPHRDRDDRSTPTTPARGWR